MIETHTHQKYQKSSVLPAFDHSCGAARSIFQHPLLSQAHKVGKLKPGGATKFSCVILGEAEVETCSVVNSMSRHSHGVATLVFSSNRHCYLTISPTFFQAFCGDSLAPLAVSLPVSLGRPEG